jgi:hypothetical protein
VFVLSSSLLSPWAPESDEQFAHAAYSGPDFWGVSETFWNITTGTHAPAAFGDVVLKQTAYTDSVVLDGWLFEMTRANMQDTVATYSPSGPPGRGPDWNLSVEITRPREASSYEGNNVTGAGRQALIVYLTDELDRVMAGVRLVTGTKVNETIEIYDPPSLSWLTITNDLRPAFTHDSAAEGYLQDRYLVSFEHANMSNETRVTVWNSGSGVLMSRNATILIPNGTALPKLRFDVDVFTAKYFAYQVMSGWMIDNLVFRSASSRYPVIGPVYEYVQKDEPLWLTVRDINGQTITDASVSIEGVPANYNAVDQRYEAEVDRAVDWDLPFNYTVISDGIEIKDIVRVSTLTAPVPRASITHWWNGWDWATVFGKDDCQAPLDAADIYIGYNHPTTSYMQLASSGNSDDVLATQAEIALHMPHDYLLWHKKNWTEAVWTADAGHSSLEAFYTYASRWDNPAYVGVGDSYISMANPGNHGSWETVYAEYLRGTRMGGIASNIYLAGNSSLLGSYWVYGPQQNQIPDWASWEPGGRMDLMDTWRGYDSNTNNTNRWTIAKTIAENGGVFRVYNHGLILDRSFLAWMDYAKTNYSYENWKATDGEITSYIYGRQSTEIVLNSSSTSSTWIYDISRQNPHESGYWNVPVTVAVDLSEKKLLDVGIQSPDWNLSMSQGTLKNLNGKRIMDIGFDIRGDVLYVSYFWNASAKLKVCVFALENPRINAAPIESTIAWADYSCEIESTIPDNGSSVWTLETDASWLSIVQSTDNKCLLAGFPLQSGRFYVKLAVSDENSTGYLNWSIVVTRPKYVSGCVMDTDGTPLSDVIVMMSVVNGKDVISVRYAVANLSGHYSVAFPEIDWKPGYKLVVTAEFNGSVAENTTVISDYPYQSVNVRFSALVPEYEGAAAVAAVTSVILVLALASVRRRFRKS